MVISLNKITSLLLTAVLVSCLTACIGQKEEPVSGKYNFSGTTLTIVVPEGWFETTISGEKYPLFYTTVEYGIKPNVRLEEVFAISSPENEHELERYFEKQLEMYPDYSILSKEAFETAENKRVDKVIATRKNQDNIPIIHISYLLSTTSNKYLLLATFAEPGRKKFEKIFDEIAKTSTI